MTSTGAVREIYAGSREYIGVDHREGPGVDRGRPEHGTRRTDRESPGTQAQGLDYYRNLTEQDVTQGLELATLFSSWAFWYLPTTFDLYFAGVRVTAGSDIVVAARLPRQRDVVAPRGMMPLPHRVARFPLHVAAWFTGSASRA